MLNVTAERWLVIFPSYELICFLDTKAACQEIVVMPANKLDPDDFWDIKEALAVQHTIDVVSAFWVFCSGFSGLLVFGLQFV